MSKERPEETITHKVFAFRVETAIAPATAIFNCVASVSILYARNRLASEPVAPQTKMI